MNPRIVVALFLVGVFALGAIVLAAGGDDTDEAPPSTFEGSLMPEGVRAPDFRLHNQDGEKVTMRSLRGRPVVVTFLYTTCQDRAARSRPRQCAARSTNLATTCPHWLSLSTRPATRPSARRHSSQSSAPPGASTSCLARVPSCARSGKGYAIRPQAVDEEHMARITLVDSRGFQRVGYREPRRHPSAWRTTCACSSTKLLLPAR